VRISPAFLSCGTIDLLWRGLIADESSMEPEPLRLDFLQTDPRYLALADVNLVSNDGSIRPAHSMVLVRNSAFFRAKLERWSKEGPSDIPIDMSPEACSLLISCLYRGAEETLSSTALRWTSPPVRELIRFADFCLNDAKLVNKMVDWVPLNTSRSSLAVLEWAARQKVAMPDFMEPLAKRARVVCGREIKKRLDDPDLKDEELLRLFTGEAK
jgi:hypothetical protein